jgi:hypothetical protein
MQTRTGYSVAFFALACFTLSAGAQPPQPDFDNSREKKCKSLILRSTKQKVGTTKQRLSLLDD